MTTNARFYDAGIELQEVGYEPRKARNAALEGGKGKERDSTLEPLIGAWPCW